MTEKMIVLDPTHKPPRFWAAYIRAAWEASARDAVLSQSRQAGPAANIYT